MELQLELELKLAGPIKSYVSLHVTHVTMDMYVCVCGCVGARPPTWPPLCISLLFCWSTVCMCRFVGKTFTLHSINLMDQSIVLFDEMQKKKTRGRRSSRWRGLASRESSH